MKYTAYTEQITYLIAAWQIAVVVAVAAAAVAAVAAVAVVAVEVIVVRNTVIHLYREVFAHNSQPDPPNPLFFFPPFPHFAGTFIYISIYNGE